MPDILVPLGRLFKRDPGVPLSLQGQVIGMPERMGDIAYSLGGRDKKPRKPLFLYGPRGEPIMLMGAGEATAAEMEDLAYEALDKAEIDFAAKRERDGYPSREKFDSLFRNALRDRMEKHRRSPRTDPPRQVGR